MQSILPASPRVAAGLVVLILAAAAGTALAFAAWVDNGPAIFMSLVEAGLAWCM